MGNGTNEGGANGANGANGTNVTNMAEEQLAELTRTIIERTQEISDKYTAALEAVMREQSRQLEQMASVIKAMPAQPETQQAPVVNHVTNNVNHVNHNHVNHVTNVNNITNVNNVTNNLTIVLDPNFYDALVRQMGPHETHKYLEHLSMTHRPLTMVHDLFIKDRTPEQQPIARRGNHFRYMNQNNLVVDDIDGTRIIKLIEKSVLNAYLSATNALIKEGLTESAPQDRVDRFHNLYRYATEFKAHDLDPSQIASYLNWSIPSTDDHPFFEAHGALLI